MQFNEEVISYQNCVIWWQIFTVVHCKSEDTSVSEDSVGNFGCVDLGNTNVLVLISHKT